MYIIRSQVESFIIVVVTDLLKFVSFRYCAIVDSMV